MKEEEGSRKSPIVKLKLSYTVVLESPSGSLNTQPAASANPTMASSVAAKTATKMISRRPSMQALGFDFESTTVVVPSRTAVKYKIIKLQNMVIDAFHRSTRGCQGRPGSERICADKGRHWVSFSIKVGLHGIE
ncbi:uncharacterized protein RAG0_00036 [Rhynchosporium agropyri]|uniref:Uncharacterized protein n=1 Tax=Rhynchosporium agropyri TaxID=914238 RepID=A0A1E1JVN8_9HELO|nr:uncharacterized protein RAG0_00036 [Rhynchosporium agropyri]